MAPTPIFRMPLSGTLQSCYTDNRWRRFLNGSWMLYLQYYVCSTLLLLLFHKHTNLKTEWVWNEERCRIATVQYYNIVIYSRAILLLFIFIYYNIIIRGVISNDFVLQYSQRRSFRITRSRKMPYIRLQGRRILVLDYDDVIIIRSVPTCITQYFLSVSVQWNSGKYLLLM